MTKQYNKHSSPILYKQGMHVWLYAYQLSNKFRNKMSKRYIGPFVITACDGSHNFKLRSIETSIQICHYQYMQIIYNHLYLEQ